MAAPRSLGNLLAKLLGPDLPVAVEAYDGSRLGRPDAPAKLVVRSPEALQRILTAPGELGFARAYVSGALDVEGDIFEVLALRDRLPKVKADLELWTGIARLMGRAALHRLPPPPEEARLSGRRHSRERDAAAVAYHYDVSNEFYRMILGPSLTYSCAVWADPSVGLERAQEAKHDLICRKLGLAPGMRLLDVGCGWGSMLLHAAAHYDVQAVGITISRRQADLAAKRISEAGLADRVEIRVQDYRDVADGPYDAISSIGMFEHVGMEQLGIYFSRLHQLLRPSGRLLNHGITRPPGNRSRFARHGFIDRYVFPDGELHEVGTVVSALQANGLEFRHGESLREHYALTLRAWVANLESSWDDAVAEVGVARARIWRLYMAAAALNFERGDTNVYQLLATRSDGGRSGMAWRPDW
jgi:cyclopropane-fatty-acyl-phospholipid synthase